MSRILKWDGTEMDVPHELFLRSMRLTFSHWTKHAAMLAAGVLWCRKSELSPKVTKMLLAGSLASYAWRVFASHAGGHRYFAHLSYKTTKWLELAMAMTIQVRRTRVAARARRARGRAHGAGCSVVRARLSAPERPRYALPCPARAWPCLSDAPTCSHRTRRPRAAGLGFEREHCVLDQLPRVSPPSLRNRGSSARMLPRQCPPPPAICFLLEPRAPAHATAARMV